MMTTIAKPRIIHVSLREGRLVTDRILLTLGLSSGCIPAIRDGILLSQAMGLGGFAHLHRAHTKLANIGYDALRIIDAAAGSLDVDGGGIHAWLIAQTITDLAVDLARRVGAGKVRISNVTGIEELAVIKALAVRHGALANIDIDQSGAVHAVVTARNAPRPRVLEQWDPLLYAAIQHHFAVEEPLWRSLYDLSNKALAPDSVVSRRHAGPNILLENGTIVGRLPADDDFDPRMLQKPDPTKLDEGTGDDNCAS